MTDFDEIAASLTDNAVWHAAVQEATAALHRERPGGVDVTLIGHRAWRELTPVQQAHTLDELFLASILRIHDEERAERLDSAAAMVKTYLEGDDEYLLQDALNGVRPIDENTTVDGVCASALSNVLDELVLVRHRLAMAKAADTPDDPS